MRLIANPLLCNTDYPDELRKRLGIDASQEARQAISGWPGYAVTPLRSLPGLAAELGVHRVLYKDEASRFGLGSFKALGGAYAVFRLLIDYLQERTGRQIAPSEIGTDSELRRYAGEFTVACATAGNHGRSVAWGAALFGCPCRIFVHDNVGDSRVRAIAAFGADVVRVRGNYDDSVRAAAAAAEQNGWTIVSDTSYPGYMDIPLYVMRGYMTMLDEAVQQLEGARPSHVFLQAGVGGLAAAACAYFWDLHGAAKPRLIVVEPERAACLQRSIEARKIVTVGGGLETSMLGLACGEPSHLAWDVLSRGAGHFGTIADGGIFACMRKLHDGAWSNESIIAGESAVAGLVGLIESGADPGSRRELELDRDSRILLFGTEGNTDPELYERIVDGRLDTVAPDQESTGSPRNPREARTR
ncbi:MAG TPA: diaminopropionate ammonia-lyase [Woeseiaceae bacterium]|nr:diaminopropionate ammonia-lyase [Woeseiaceae bacterium]